MKEAEAHSDEDARRKEQIELKNQLDSFVYQTEKTFKEHGEKLSPDDRHALDEALAKAKKAIEADELEQLRAAKASLEQVAHRLSEVMYSADQAAAAAGGAAGGPANAGADEASDDDGVIDAEEVN